MNNAADRRQKVWGGMRRGDWIGVFLGRMVVPADEARPPFWRTNLVHRQVWFSSFHLTPENMTSYVAEIRRRRLRFLEGYPSTLFILAQHLIATGETLPMEAVFSSSETLHQVQLEAILAAFGCTPFDFYGHAERAIFATECELHEGKHLAEEYGFAEIVNEEGTSLPDGEFGYLTGTSLFNIAMPMIRYRTTDISAIMHEPCKCGRSLRRIENISTKAEDIVVTPDGRMISPSVLTHPFKPFPQIVASQLVQERADRLVVKIIPSDRFTPENQAELLRSLGARLGPAVQLDLQIVEDIPRERSGKFRWVISHVAHPSVFQWEQPG
jgi:phenylacetate-CoA ligase